MVILPLPLKSPRISRGRKKIHLIAIFSNGTCYNIRKSPCYQSLQYVDEWTNALLKAKVQTCIAYNLLSNCQVVRMSMSRYKDSLCKWNGWNFSVE